MGSFGVHNAKTVSESSEIGVHPPDHRIGRILEINIDKTAYRASHLIHQTTGFSEELVFRHLRRNGDGHGIDLHLVVQTGQDVADHYFESSGGRQAGSAQYVAGNKSLKSSDFVSSRLQICCHTPDQSGRGSLLLGVRSKTVQIHFQRTVAFGFERNLIVIRRSSHRDHIKIDGSSQDLSMLMVGMISAHLASAGGTVHFDFILSVKLPEFLQCVDIPAGLALCKGFIHIDLLQSFIMKTFLQFRNPLVNSFSHRFLLSYRLLRVK